MPDAEERLLRMGERVILLDSKRRRYLVTLRDGGEFHSHAGFVPHADIVGRPEGTVVRSTKGRRVHRAASRRSRTSWSRCRGAPR